MISITQIEYLLAVHETKHFGKAAKKCAVSQPSLSTQIQKLEEELDVVVFDRSKKPILTTDLGLKIIEQCESVLREHRRINDIAFSDASIPQGDFKLAVIPTLAPYIIPQFLHKFSLQYPKVNLKISESITEQIIEDLENDKIDAGCLVTPLGDSSLIERHLFYEPFYVFASEQSSLSTKKTVKESQLEGGELWLLEEGHCFRDQVLRVCSLNKRDKVLPNVEFTSGNLETLKNLVLKGKGFTFLPELAIEQLSDQQKKTNLKKFTKPIPTREVSLVHSRSFLKEGIISALEDTIIKTLPKKIRSLKRGDFKIIDL